MVGTSRPLRMLTTISTKFIPNYNTWEYTYIIIEYMYMRIHEKYACGTDTPLPVSVLENSGLATSVGSVFGKPGPLSIALHLWKYDMSTGTEPLELAIIILPVISHILMLIWVCYMFFKWIMSHCGYQFNTCDCKAAVSDLANAANSIFTKDVVATKY